MGTATVQGLTDIEGLKTTDVDEFFTVLQFKVLLT
jgi:hypothetical protein